MTIPECLESFFFRHGRMVAGHPYVVVASCAAFATLLSASLLGLQWDFSEAKLWLAENSAMLADWEWVSSVHPPSVRLHSVVFSAEGGGDVLQPKYIKQMYEARKVIYETALADGSNWEDYCLKAPVVKIPAVQGTSAGNEDPSLYLPYPEPYCSILNGLKKICQEDSILELWANDGKFDDRAEQAIMAASKEDIIYRINSRNKSGLFLVDKDFVGLLGGVERDDSGRIVSARAARFDFAGLAKTENSSRRPSANQAEEFAFIGDGTADDDILEMESALIDAMLDPTWHIEGFRVDVALARSKGDAVTSAVYTDLPMAVAGFAAVYIYVAAMMGGVGSVECRGFLAGAGIISVLVAITGAYGLPCLLGQPINAMYGVMPFLIVGLGVDDMFIIIQAFEMICQDKGNSRAAVEEKFGHTMRISGVAITVTSLTDLVSFGLGATTSIPGLRSLCLSCAVGVVVVYFMQATWFLAWFAIANRSVEDGKSGIISCAKKPKKCSPPSPKDPSSGRLKRAFAAYGEALMLTPVRISVCLATAILFGLSMYGVLSLRQHSSFRDFLPQDSYLEKYYETQDRYFYEATEDITVFLAGLDLPRDLKSVDTMKDLVVGVDWWGRSLENYHELISGSDGTDLSDLGRSEFRSVLARYLFSPAGGAQRVRFEFEGDLVCGQPVPDIKIFTLGFSQWKLDTLVRLSAKAAAVDRCVDVVQRANLTGGSANKKAFPLSASYIYAASEKVLRSELFRNISLAFGGVGLTTFLLMSNLQATAQVLASVALTLSNVGGFMYLWGLNIETLSCMVLIICVGISIDYSAHIAQCFLRQEGCAKSRCIGALAEVGPAVFNGAFSTFLSVSVLILANSHAVVVFFKVFTLSIAFAFYNSVVALPVAMSFLGCTTEAAKAMKDGLDKEEEEELLESTTE